MYVEAKLFRFAADKYAWIDFCVLAISLGILVQLCYPYPRAVSEPAVYEDANVVTTGLTDEEVEQLKERLDPKSSSGGRKRSNSSVPASGDRLGTRSGSSVTGSMSLSVQAQYTPDLSVGRNVKVLLFFFFLCFV